MQQFYLISNPYRDEGLRLLDTVEKYLTERGGRCFVQEQGSDKPPLGTEAVIVLGGDGTLLRTVRRFADMNLRFIGINTGHVGYLAEGDKDHIPELLDCLLEDRYTTEERMVVYARVIRDGHSVARHRALNEILIGRSQTNMKIMTMDVFLNGQFLTRYRADGLIISTPTGSTAYSFSAGGPIVEPTAKLFVMTPLASHSLNNRSLIFSNRDKLAVRLVQERPESFKNDYQVIFDGDKHVQLQPGDRVEIAEATTSVCLIKLNDRSFVETLRSKITI